MKAQPGIVSFLLLASSSSWAMGCQSNYPNQMEVFKLRKGQVINADGVLDEDAWAEVPWSENFQDIQGPLLRPNPRLETKVKLRYDAECLWVGAYLEEPEAWANTTQTNSVIFQDNDFEVFLDPDGNTHYYRELEINAYGTEWNLMLVRPYLNGGPAVCNFTYEGQCSYNDPEHGVDDVWDVTSDLKIGVSIRGGKINDPRQVSKNWTLEICLPLKDYALYEEVNVPPKDGDYWRINFSRVQYKVMVHTLDDGTEVYWKDLDSPADNWVFQPHGVVNIHLPERWGYLRFSEEDVLTNAGRISAQDPLWAVRYALAQVYESQKIYDMLYGTLVGYAESVISLVMNGHLSQEVADGRCAGMPKIVLNDDASGFEVQIASMQDPNVIGHIADDRRIWFTRT